MPEVDLVSPGRHGVRPRLAAKLTLVAVAVQQEEAAGVALGAGQGAVEEGPGGLAHVYLFIYYSSSRVLGLRRSPSHMAPFKNFRGGEDP